MNNMKQFVLKMLSKMTPPKLSEVPIYLISAIKNGFLNKHVHTIQFIKISPETKLLTMSKSLGQNIANTLEYSEISGHKL